jgi:hypothetical protein
MHTSISIILPGSFHQLEDWQDAVRFAEQTHGAVYSWKTSEAHNWLERGISLVDVLGLVVLPDSLPVEIEMPDDPDDTAEEEQGLGGPRP